MVVEDYKAEMLPQGRGIKGLYQVIELAGRTCYKSESMISEDSAEKFVKRMIDSKHYAMLEHGTVYLYRSSEEETDEFKSFVEKYRRNKYSCVNFNKYKGMYNVYITTNYRVIIENKWDEDMKYFSKFTQFHEPRRAVRFVLDVGVGREFTRHRVFSFAQESSRYCLAGDTKLKFSNPHVKFTISDLYNNKLHSRNSAWKRMRIRQMDENGNLIYSKIKDIIYNGKQDVYELKTKLGYTIKCTKEHEIYTACGYKELQSINVGDKIYVNGTICDSDEPYKKYEWLYHQNITLNKTFVEISKEFNYNVNTIKKWAKKLNLPKKGTGYFNIGRTPWNKNLSEGDDNRVKNQADALRKYHHCGRRKDTILKTDTSNYFKYKKTNCSVCGTSENLEVHHIDKNHNNNNPENLITLCESCHGRIHSQNLDIIALDEVVSINKCGEEDVYDLSMYENENFVANGIIVHNCNYSKEKFGNSLHIIRPSYMKDIELGEYKTTGIGWIFTAIRCLFDGNLKFIRSIRKAERSYMQMIKDGHTPQEARCVLPMCTKSELVMTGFMKDWKHFFDLRFYGTTGAPHPDAKYVSEKLLNCLVFKRFDRRKKEKMFQ